MKKNKSQVMWGCVSKEGSIYGVHIGRSDSEMKKMTGDTVKQVRVSIIPSKKGKAR